MSIFTRIANFVFGNIENTPMDFVPASTPSIKARAYVKSTVDGRVALFDGDKLVYTYASRAAATRGAARRGITLA